MGVKLGSIVNFQTIPLKELENTKIAVDASNMLLQFLSKIKRQSLPLINHEGRVVSHIYGVLYRTINFLERGIKPIYVFDGSHPRLKKRREHLVESLVKEYDHLRKARENKDYHIARTISLSHEILYDTIINEAQRLLTYMGIPWIKSPGEAEAQAAYMTRINKADHVLTQDYDALLFGAKSILRSLKFNEDNIQCTNLEDVLKLNGITYEQLVDLAVLVGTDFNSGVKGVGAKKALKLVKKQGNIVGVLSELGLNPSEFDGVREIFLNPDVVDPQALFNAPNTGSLRKLLEDFRMKPERIDRGIRRLVRAYKDSQLVQTTL